MRIAVIHQYYLAAGQAGGSRFNEMSRMWSEAGHEVTVLAGTVEYSTGLVPEKYQGRWITEEHDGDVRVLRCHVPSTYGKGYLGRAWAFAGFMASSSMAVRKLQHPDVVVATSPPLVVSPSGWLASRRRFGKPVPWVFEVRDLWPESAVTTGVLSAGSPVTRVLSSLEKWSYRHADHIVVLTPAFRDDIAARNLAAVEKMTLIPNGADTDLFHPGSRDNDLRRELGWGDRFVVMYAGAHGRANAVGQLVEAADLLRDRPEILIAMVGDGPERLQHEKEAQRRGLTNIVFHGPRPKGDMPAIVQACDVGAAVLQDNPTFRTVYPNKVFDTMACRRPVLLAIDGVARDLVCKEAQGGVFVAPENPRALAEGIVSLYENPEDRDAMASRGLAWVQANGTRTIMASRYLDLFNSLRSPSSP